MGWSKSEDIWGKRPSSVFWISQVLFGPCEKRQKKGEKGWFRPICGKGGQTPLKPASVTPPHSRQPKERRKRQQTKSKNISATKMPIKIRTGSQPSRNNPTRDLMREQHVGKSRTDGQQVWAGIGQECWWHLQKTIVQFLKVLPAPLPPKKYQFSLYLNNWVCWKVAQFFPQL